MSSGHGFGACGTSAAGGSGASSGAVVALMEGCGVVEVDDGADPECCAVDTEGSGEDAEGCGAAGVESAGDAGVETAVDAAVDVEGRGVDVEASGEGDGWT